MLVKGHRVAVSSLTIKVSLPRRSDFNRVISDIFAVQWETTLTISDSIETDTPFETEVVKVVSFSTTEITDLPRTDTFTKISKLMSCFFFHNKKKKSTFFLVKIQNQHFTRQSRVQSFLSLPESFLKN